eukprot:142627-Lingulodinium_polyedra.AAC.1
MKWWAQAVGHAEDNDCVPGCRRDLKDKLHLSFPVGSVPRVMVYKLTPRRVAALRALRLSCGVP